MISPLLALAHPAAHQDTNISLNISNKSIEDILENIQQQSGYKFIYKDGDFDFTKKLTIKVKNQSVTQVLNKVFSGMAVEYQISNRQIVLKRIQEKAHVSSQDNVVLKGKVTDAQGDGLPGATVVEKQTGNGTTTGVDGSFSLKVTNSNAILVISFIGYQTREIPAGQGNNMNIQLLADASSLKELVVIGYGTESKRNITGAISTIDPKEIISQPKANIGEMLDGRVAGVQVMSDNGPGGGVAFRIRGFSTINSNDPLIIIDGIPVQSSLNSINPADIETIQILKDAASASIYGARAANGVVIITSKKGRKGESGPQLSLNAYSGFQANANMPKMLNAQQYGDLLWQATINDGRTPSDDIYGSDPVRAVIPAWIDAEQTIPTADVNWLDAISRKALVQSYDLSLSKATDKSQQLFSLGYYDQKGVLQYTFFKRYSARMNSSYKIGKYLNIGENLAASVKEGVGVGTNAALGSIILSALDYLPVLPIRDINGNFVLNPANDDTNPLEGLYRGKDNKGKTISTLGNVYASLDFNHLTLKTALGLEYQTYNARSYSPSTKNALGSLSTSNSFYRQFSITNTLNYSNYFGKHSVDLLFGQEAIDFYSENFSASRSNFLYDDLSSRYLDYGTSNQLNSGNASGWALNSYFGRLNYRFDDKYLATVTMRRDGSSRFMGKNKWHVFPAFSLGWRLDKEFAFSERTPVSSMLLRGTWGQTGNQDIASYSTVDSYRSNNANSNYAIDGSQGAVYTGLTQSRIANPDLKWETTTQTGAGIDFGLWNDKLTVSADYYYKTTQNILVYSTVPLTYGGTNDGQWINGGAMKNTGIELDINYAGQISKLGYNIGLNFTRSRNSLTQLTSSDYLGIPSSSLHTVNFDQEISRSAVGQPIGSFYGYVADGLFNSQEEVDTYGMQPNARPGDIRFRDVNGDGKVDASDRTFIGSPHPSIMLGANLKFNYGHFDLSMLINGSFGNKVYNFTRYRGHFFNQNTNKSTDLLNAWTPTNTDTKIPRLSLDDPNNNIRPSSYYVENGSYVRLNNIQLGYNLPAKLISGKTLRLYIQSSNLFTITGYSGINPQVGLQNYSGSNRNLDIGIDRGLYPPSRSFVIGCNFNF